MSRPKPTFQRMLELMKSSDGSTREDGFSWLQPRAADYVDELVEAFSAESDRGLRCWLLELIGYAQDPKCFTLLVEQTTADDESLRYWAVSGLKRLDTKRARTFLYKRQHPNNDWLS